MRAPARRWFLFGTLFEAALGIVGLLGAHLLALPWPEYFRCDLFDVAWGTGATLPLLSLLWWLRKTSAAPIVRIRDFLDYAVRPVLGQWSVWQLGIISIVAGVGEELLFRGLVQAELTRLAGAIVGVITASALFGGFHAVTRAYAVLAGLIGMYLGLLWIISGSLAAAMLTHAMYDFVALLWFVRCR